jgi:hypothetical protein
MNVFLPGGTGQPDRIDGHEVVCKVHVGLQLDN